MTTPAHYQDNIDDASFRVLYVGTEAGQSEHILSRVETEIGFRQVSGVADAMKMARTTPIDCVIIDQRRESNQAALLTAALAAETNVKQIVILTSPENSAAYEALGKKCQVLFYPVKPIEMIAAVFANAKSHHVSSNDKFDLKKNLTKLTKIKWSKFSFPLNFSRAMIPFVSFVYKNTALVLLTALFAVFLSYGVMIVFFLISNGWSAPLTLSKGHDLVVKVEQQIGDMKIKNNLIKQRISKEQDELTQAKRSLGDARVLANLVASTLDSEIEQRLLLQKDMKAQISRLVVLQRQMKRATGKNGIRSDLGQKFKKRLINRQVYNSSLLAALELQQRQAGVQNEIATQRRESIKISQSIIMLASLRQQIQKPEIEMITAANAEFVPLANQVITVKTTLKNAHADLLSHSERLRLLNENSQITKQAITELAATPLARAASKPVVVLFVPYENGKNYQTDQRLYSCRFGVTWCSVVGYTGKSINGEIISVHPFFGKNMRGSFVEAILTDPEAAKKEVLHVGRPPLFF